MSAIIDLAEAAKRIQAGETAAVDARFVLGDPDSGRRAYEAGHLPGAVHFDLERDLASEVGEHGGRHPLPDLGALAIKLGHAGIDEHTPVIVYDDQGGAMASRFWWLLRFLGHARVQVLDGGFAKWAEAGYPVTREVPAPAPKTFSPQVQTRMHVSMEELREKLHAAGVTLIDSREEARYVGATEPIDRVAGHIPGAKNRFWRGALRPDGGWRSPEGQAERFADIPPEEEVIVYCGSGVTACPNVLALMEAGFPNVRLYLGSWSDWISYPENPIATGEE